MIEQDWRNQISLGLARQKKIKKLISAEMNEPVLPWPQGSRLPKSVRPDNGMLVVEDESPSSENSDFFLTVSCIYTPFWSQRADFFWTLTHCCNGFKPPVFLDLDMTCSLKCPHDSWRKILRSWAILTIDISRFASGAWYSKHIILFSWTFQSFLSPDVESHFFVWIHVCMLYIHIYI